MHELYNCMHLGGVCFSEPITSAGLASTNSLYIHLELFIHSFGVWSWFSVMKYI